MAFPCTGSGRPLHSAPEDFKRTALSETPFSAVVLVRTTRQNIDLHYEPCKKKKKKRWISKILLDGKGRGSLSINAFSLDRITHCST